ncbi:MAG: glycosyltransferase family 39 protein [bacterium]|nr:glycosyltransferase family 39 protein [bacterium]MCM1373454.1 glycosyltransferase family 39 protein [Muribaculum sp.]
MKKEILLLLTIMLLSLSTMLYYGAKKEGYHVDELYSYGLANSEYLPFMHFGESGYDVKDWMMEYGAGESLGDLLRNLAKDFKLIQECGFRPRDSVIYADYLTAQANSSDTKTTTWMSGQAYQDYLAASESNTFNYASVYYNQRGDVHPPLYYILLHTICSLFQGTFSKWFGLALNFTVLLLTLGVLYRMVSSYLGGEKVALAVVLSYALSCGFMTTAVFLRMYALLTLMVMLCSYMHLRLAADNFVLTRKTRAWLILITLGGFLTHYYFVIYALATAVVLTVWMTSKKKWRELLSYILTMTASAVIGLCVWPFAIKHVFLGYRGRESLDALATGEFHWIKVKVILHSIFQYVFHGWWWIPLVCAAVIILALISMPKGKRPLGKLLLLAVPNVIYLLLVPQIVPYYVERYFMCTFPFWCLLATGGIWMGTGALTRCTKLFAGALSRHQVTFQTAVTITFSVFLMVLSNSWLQMPGNLYTGGQETIEVPEHTACVYVMPDGSWNESASFSSVFAQCDQVAVLYQSSLPSLKDSYSHQEGNHVLVMVSASLEAEPVLEEVCGVLGLQGLQITNSREYGGVMMTYLSD